MLYVHAQSGTVAIYTGVDLGILEGRGRGGGHTLTAAGIASQARGVWGYAPLRKF